MLTLNKIGKTNEEIIIMKNNNVQKGKVAPDFEVLAVFDEEFGKIDYQIIEIKSMMFYFFTR